MLSLQRQSQIRLIDLDEAKRIFGLDDATLSNVSVINCSDERDKVVLQDVIRLFLVRGGNERIVGEIADGQLKDELTAAALLGISKWKLGNYRRNGLLKPPAYIQTAGPKEGHGRRTFLYDIEETKKQLKSRAVSIEASTDSGVVKAWFEDKAKAR
jgi:hypothetical protein